MQIKSMSTRGPQKLSTLKSLKISKPPTDTRVFDLAIIRNGFLIKFQMAKP